MHETQLQTDQRKIIIHSPGAYQRYGHNYDYVDGLAAGFAAHGYDTTVYALPGPLRGTATQRPLDYRRTPWALFRRYTRELLLLVESARQAKRSGELLVLESFEAVTALAVLSIIRPPALAAIVHDPGAMLENNQSSIRWYRQLQKTALSRLMRIGAKLVSHEGPAFTALRELFPNQEADLVEIPYGTRVTPLPSSDPEPPLRLLAFGTTRSDKQYEPFLDAVRQLPDWELLVVGPSGSAEVNPGPTDTRITRIDRFIDADEQPEVFSGATAVLANYKADVAHASGTMNLALGYQRPIVASGPTILGQIVEQEGLGWYVGIEPTTPDIIEILSEITRSIADGRYSGVLLHCSEAAQRRSWPVVAQYLLHTLP